MVSVTAVIDISFIHFLLSSHHIIFKEKLMQKTIRYFSSRANFI